MVLSFNFMLRMAATERHQMQSVAIPCRRLVRPPSGAAHAARIRSKFIQNARVPHRLQNACYGACVRIRAW